MQEPIEWPRNQQRHTFGAREAKALGDKFAEHNLQNREEPKRKYQRAAVRHDGGPRLRNHFHQRS